MGTGLMVPDDDAIGTCFTVPVPDDDERYENIHLWITYQEGKKKENNLEHHSIGSLYACLVVGRPYLRLVDM